MRTYLISQLVKNPPAMQEIPVRFLGREDPVEKGQATHPSILGLPSWLSWWRIHLQCGRPEFNPSIGKIHCRRERLPTPVIWPGEFHGLYSLWGHKESDTTERLSLSFFHFRMGAIGGAISNLSKYPFLSLFPSSLNSNSFSSIHSLPPICVRMGRQILPSSLKFWDNMEVWHLYREQPLAYDEILAKWRISFP